MRSSWNRSRATAIAVTLLLHGVLAVWLLSLKIAETSPAIDVAEIDWIPPLEPPPPAPPSQPASIATEPVEPPTFLLPVPEETQPAEAMIDWYGDARAVAGAFGSAPERRSFGPGPPREHKLKSAPDRPPSIFEEPLPRVGTSMRTTEGESILWISDYCYISLDTQSLTMKEIHNGRKGVRTCIIPIGKRKARGDLFDHLKKKPPVKPAGEGPGQQ